MSLQPDERLRPGAERRAAAGRIATGISHALGRRLARRFSRRLATIPADFVPTVTFTFDDFPQSAADAAVPILRAAGMSATWYAASDLLGQTSPCGVVANASQLSALVAAGHEIGDHTCRHLDAGAVPTAIYARDMDENRRILADHLPGIAIRSFAYPFGSVTLGAKRAAMARATTCRGTVAGIARGTIDLALLPANALYDGAEPVATALELIEQLGRAGGWAIFYTHDVTNAPSRWGCTPDSFSAVVEMVARARLRVATVGTVAGELLGGPA